MSDLHHSRTVHGGDGATQPRILIEDTTGTAVHAPVPGGVALRALLIQQTQRTLARLHRDYPAGRCSDYELTQTAEQLEAVAAILREANQAFGEPR